MGGIPCMQGGGPNPPFKQSHAGLSEGSLPAVFVNLQAQAAAALRKHVANLSGAPS